MRLSHRSELRRVQLSETMRKTFNAANESMLPILQHGIQRSLTK